MCIGVQVDKDTVHSEGLLHRDVWTFVFNHEGHMLMLRRNPQERHPCADSFMVSIDEQPTKQHDP